MACGSFPLFFFFALASACLWAKWRPPRRFFFFVDELFCSLKFEVAKPREELFAQSLDMGNELDIMRLEIPRSIVFFLRNRESK